MSRAVEWGLIKSHYLNKVKSLRVDNAVARYLDQKEEKSLLEALRARDKRIKVERDIANLFWQQRKYPLLPKLRDFYYADHLEPIVILAMNNGLRKGEHLSLRWENVDLVNDHITIRGADAKSGKSRHIPLNQNAKRALSQWRFDVEKVFKTFSVCVFEGDAGKHLADIKKAGEI
ncbi:tyrosine-type recombinase/integrase [Glaciecola sp. XM2]|jgi:integrase|uniref:tyrosine-type recombinase/integrase n=1 Tax=Glaciecola sp. XM2 TaxID=1914931 RepID=UPI001BDDFCA9|nr:tyrosine-type recombinase/integrase [Glaciecola sp. XM2]MBT1452429.1 tyrosine-type recombinase/integrase [Glaciecola sp. XM2]